MNNDKFVRLQKDATDNVFTVGVYAIEDIESMNRLYTLEVDSQKNKNTLRLYSPDNKLIHEYTLQTLHNLILTRTRLHNHVLASISELLRLVDLEAVFP